MKYLQFFVAILFCLFIVCHAETLNFPSYTPVTCTVTQNWLATGTLDDDPITERCHSQLEFEIQLSPTKNNYEKLASFKLKRLVFDVQTKNGISATYDSSHPEKSNPVELNQILKGDLFLNIPLNYTVFDIGMVFDEKSEFHEKFMKTVQDKIFQTTHEHLADIYEATQWFWFLKSHNFKRILSEFFYNTESDIKKGDYYLLDSSPKFFTELFAAKYDDIANGWFSHSPYFSQDLILFINEITSSDILGSWSGESSIKIKGPSGIILSENAVKTGTVSWNRKNAMLQNRSWVWEGDFDSILNNTPSKIHFVYEEAIQAVPAN